MKIDHLLLPIGWGLERSYAIRRGCEMGVEDEPITREEVAHDD